MRNKHKEQLLKKHGVKLGVMSPFVRAAAFALQDQPVVNAGVCVCVYKAVFWDTNYFRSAICSLVYE